MSEGIKAGRSRLTKRFFASELVRGGLAALSMRVAAVLASLAASVILARSLGPEQYGIYAFVFSIISILSLPVKMGLPTLTLRETAQARATGQWGRLIGIWHWSSLLVLAASAIIIVAVVLALLLFPALLGNERQNALLFALPLIPFLTLSELGGAALRGLRHILLGLFPAGVLRPLLLAIVISLFLLFWPNDLTAGKAMHLHSAVACICCLTVLILLTKVRPFETRASRTPIFLHRSWLKSILPLTLVAGMQMISHNTDLIMLGIYRSDAEVGQYRVATSIATLGVFGLTAVNLVLQPRFAELFALKDHESLQRLTSLSSMLSLAFALPALMVVWVLGRGGIAQLYDPLYLAAYVPLIVLMCGQTVNALFGPVGNLLIMSGNETKILSGLSIATICNVILNFIFIPEYGTQGAAAATAISGSLLNIYCWKAAMVHLKIDSSPLSYLGIRRP